MRVLVVQNYDDTGPGQVGDALAAAGAELDIVTAQRGTDLPDGAAHHDALLVLGGAQNALDDGHSPYFPALLSLIRAFAQADRSVLGICLGSQLIARAFGAENRLGAAEEFGWQPVRLTPGAAGDALFAGLPGEFPIFQWHDDTFGLPPGAVRLATSAAAENQAFRIGRAVYGIQFHFEADRPLVRAWSEAFAAAIAERHPDWAARHDAEAARFGPAADAIGRRLAEAWIATVGAGVRAPAGVA